MHKLVVTFAFLPLLAACAGTSSEGVKTTQNCKMVSQEDTGSNIKTRRVCDTTAEGGSATTQRPDSTRAPQ